MNITDIVAMSAKPPLYKEGNAFMWTDEHISNYLLDTHLNPEIDLASRTRENISKTTNWILSLLSKKKNLKILDLGCGPGLYTEKFAKTGHKVFGIDISRKSIDYAISNAERQSLDIQYANASYLDYDFGESKYDLITLIYTDLGVLLPDQREILLGKVYKALKAGGIFVFDLLKNTDLISRLTQNIWESAESGFWSEIPYVALSSSFLYEEDDVILYQHIISEVIDKTKLYRFWTHFFSEKKIETMLSDFKYDKVEFRDDILPENDIWSGSKVIFTIATK